MTLFVWVFNNISYTKRCNISLDPITKHLIEYCVKDLLKGDIVICPGVEVLGESVCIIRKGVNDWIYAGTVGLDEIATLMCTDYDF